MQPVLRNFSILNHQFCHKPTKKSKYVIQINLEKNSIIRRIKLEWYLISIHKKWFQTHWLIKSPFRPIDKWNDCLPLIESFTNHDREFIAQLQKKEGITFKNYSVPKNITFDFSDDSVLSSDDRYFVLKAKANFGTSWN